MHNLIYLEEVDSTNNFLKAHCGELEDGTAVTARVQTAGRGRRGHAWSDDEGMLPLSVLLKNPVDCDTLTARAGLAVCDAIVKTLKNPPEIGLKWANDIIIANRKVCGILCESVFFGDCRNVVCGIGINISQSGEFFRGNMLPHAGSLLSLTGQAPERDELLRAVTEAVKIRAAMPFADCYDEYKSRLVNLGRTVRIISPNDERVAVAVDVAPNGFLICRDESGEFEVSSGEVSVRGLDGYV